MISSVLITFSAPRFRADSRTKSLRLQDWLHNEFDGSIAMGTESATLGRTWLMQMNEGAENTNVTIQMCMAYLRHMIDAQVHISKRHEYYLRITLEWHRIY